jgi:hypothetical protein
VNGEPKAPEGPGLATATVALKVAEERFRARLTVPTGPTLPERPLPVLRLLAESLAGSAVAGAEAAGERVS